MGGEARREKRRKGEEEKRRRGEEDGRDLPYILPRRRVLGGGKNP